MENKLNNFHTGKCSTDIKDHAIQFGFEYEKRTDRWFVAPNSLWGLLDN